jgi:hypothetical protein
MDAGRLVSRCGDLMSAPVDREIVFLHPTADSYVALDEIGRRVWDLLERPRRIADLVGVLEEEFEAPAGAIERDVVALIEELERDGIVRVEDPDTA